MSFIGYLPLNCNIQVMNVYDTLVLYFGNPVKYKLLLANPLFCYNAILQMVSQKVGCYKKYTMFKVGIKQDDHSYK